jgi:hypothetical protein
MRAVRRAMPSGHGLPTRHRYGGLSWHFTYERPIALRNGSRARSRRATARRESTTCVSVSGVSGAVAAVDDAWLVQDWGSRVGRAMPVRALAAAARTLYLLSKNDLTAAKQNGATSVAW